MDIVMVEIDPMNFICYQKLVKMVKNVYCSKGLSHELALEMGFNLHCLCMNYFKLLNFLGMNCVLKKVEAYLTEGWMINFVTINFVMMNQNYSSFIKVNKK